jgi:hypothetical protein
VTATVAASCVKPGGAQTLYLNGPSGYFYSFDAQYSNGKDGRQYGGEGVGKIPSTGSFRSTWVVTPNAPAGSVIVWVAATGGHPQESAFRQPRFTVSRSCS